MAAPTGGAVLSDGTVLTFDWVLPDGAASAWKLNDAHHEHGRTPMQQWFEQHGVAGHDRAWDEPGIPPPSYFHRFQVVGPFHYARVTPDPPERMGLAFAALGQVLGEHGGCVPFWTQWCLPRVEEVCRQLEDVPDDAPLQRVAEDFEYALHQTFTSILALFANVMPMGMMLDAVGLDGRSVAQQVVQGGRNASQEIDAEICRLADLARADPEVAAMAATGTPDDALAGLRELPVASAFLADFDTFVSRHSRRSQGWDFHLLTWGERPESVLALVRAHLAGTALRPEELEARSGAGRAEAMALALAALAPEQHDQFRGLAAAGEGYVGVREDRAYWQMVLCGAARLALLRQGRRLVGEGRLAQADDILWLVPPDFEGTTGDLRRLVAERRSEWNRLTALAPPQQIGTVSADFAPPTATSATELRGFGVSRGRVTGIARVLLSPDDGDRLEPGDILVCRMTTPSWTPLFALAGAVVTETGNSISHPAITAREYGIPAVLSVTGAGSAIADGTSITVDGDTGTVTLEA